MRWAYAVTFESTTRAPETVRGTVEGGALHTCIYRAAKEAKGRVPPNRHYSSVVVVLLDRLDRGADAEDESEDVADSESEASAEV